MNSFFLINTNPILLSLRLCPSAGLGHTLVCCVGWVQGSGQVCRGFPGSWSRCTLSGILEPQGAIPPGSYPSWGGWVYCLASEAPLFRRMLTGVKAFLESLGVSELWPCAQTHLKKSLVPHSSGRWVIRQIPTFSQHWTGTHLSRLCWLVHGSGQVCLGSTGSQSRPSIMDSSWPAFISGVPRPASSSLRGLSSQDLIFLWGAKFIAWCLRHIFLTEYRWGLRHFQSLLACLGYDTGPEPI